MNLLIILKTLIFYMFFLHFLSANAQENYYSRTRIEPFFNITDVLVKFTGNGNNSSLIFTSPFIIGAKIRNKSDKGAFRVGTNFNVDISDDNLATLSRTTQKDFYSFTMGYEWRRKIAEKFSVHAGIDVSYLDEINKTTVNDFGNGKSIFSNRRNGPGGGAVFGFSWHITNRITLFTESSLSFYYLNQYEYVLDNSNFKSIRVNKTQVLFRPVAPNSLFLIFKI